MRAFTRRHVVAGLGALAMPSVARAETRALRLRRGMNLWPWFSLTRAARENMRVPWYGWQEAPGRPARAQQPFNGYGAPARSPVLHLRAGRTKRLTRAGGWGDGSALGVVTVTTAAGRASTTRALGAGMESARLRRPLRVRAGETYTISASGSVPLARADGYVDAIFGALPWSTDGAGSDRAQLFAS